MTRPLGSTQQAVLDALRDHGKWHRRSGWLWDTESNTRRLLDSLVRRGLVVVRDEPFSYPGSQQVHPLDVYYPVDLDDDELYTLIGLQLGPLPFPKNSDYDGWSGAGFGLDMLANETLREHEANRAWRDQACVIAAQFQGTKTEHQIRQTIDGFWKRQQKAAYEKP